MPKHLSTNHGDCRLATCAHHSLLHVQYIRIQDTDQCSKNIVHVAHALARPPPTIWRELLKQQTQAREGRNEALSMRILNVITLDHGAGPIATCRCAWLFSCPVVCACAFALVACSGGFKLPLYRILFPSPAGASAEYNMRACALVGCTH